MNLEEPAAFNSAVQDFLHAVENDRWPARDGRKSYTLIPPSKHVAPSVAEGPLSKARRCREKVPARVCTSVAGDGSLSSTFSGRTFFNRSM